MGYPYAGLKPRAAAMAFDFLIIAAYAAVLAVVGTVLVLTTSVEQLMASPYIQDGVAFVTLVLPVILYFSLQESSPRQATIGKRKAGLKVIDARGEKISAGQALLRSGVKFLPWQMAHTAVIQLWYGNASAVLFAVSILAQVVVIIYLVFLWAGRQHRTPYDWIAGTAVVRAGAVGSSQEVSAAIR